MALYRLSYGAVLKLVIDNLQRVYERASVTEVAAGMAAYTKYHVLVTEIALKHGFPKHIGAAVFSALSPNNTYWGNLRDTDRLLGAAYRGEGLDSFKVSTYGQNKTKAWEIAKGGNPLQRLVANKTRSFFLNVSDPNNPWPVTIDGHMRNIWFSEKVGLQARGMTPALYRDIAAGVRALADKHGMLPNQLQATLWLTWRRMHSIQTPAQMELWDVDRLVAGLGFGT